MDWIEMTKAAAMLVTALAGFLRERTVKKRRPGAPRAVTEEIRKRPRRSKPGKAA
jgi:hypothetical protein